MTRSIAIVYLSILYLLLIMIEFGHGVNFGDCFNIEKNCTKECRRLWLGKCPMKNETMKVVANNSNSSPSDGNRYELRYCCERSRSRLIGAILGIVLATILLSAFVISLVYVFYPDKKKPKGSTGASANCKRAIKSADNSNGS